MDLRVASPTNAVRAGTGVRPSLRHTPRGRHALSLHDLPELTLVAARPMAFQLDGEYLGERESVTLRAVPAALQVVA